VIATDLVLTEGGLLMKLKTNIQAGQNFNNNVNQAAAFAYIGGGGGGGGVINQNFPTSNINNNN
jgi:hypothetical protein